VFRTFPIVCVLWMLSTVALSQAPTQPPLPGSAKSLLIAPFENVSKAPGIEWIGESFPEVLGQRLASSQAGLQIMSRNDRLRAFDRAGMPSGLHPSRATMFQIAEQLDLDYVVIGTYDFDGRTFTVTCQRLDVKRAHLSNKISESGPLLKLIDVQTALAWDLLRLDDSALTSSRDAFVAAAPPIRLDSLENYTRGVIASALADKIRYFKEALRINPLYAEAQMALGEAYFDSKQYDPAAATLAKVPASHPSAGRAQFLLGLCDLYLGQPEKAEPTLADLSTRVPLPEVFNNLGVARSRLGRMTALEPLQRAAETDPSDSDYRFNLAVALFRKGDATASTREIRTFLAANPNDGEAKSLLEALVAASDPKFAATAPQPKLPPERIKRTYNEDSFRQIAAQIQAADEQRLATSDPHAHAQFHVSRGKELLGQGFAAEAAKDFREAVALDPGNADAQAGIAATQEVMKKP
jgi:tetratricopeptide (TPR) repeat protein